MVDGWLDGGQVLEDGQDRAVVLDDPLIVQLLHGGTQQCGVISGFMRPAGSSGVLHHLEFMHTGRVCLYIV